MVHPCRGRRRTTAITRPAERRRGRRHRRINRGRRHNMQLRKATREVVHKATRVGVRTATQAGRRGPTDQYHVRPLATAIVRRRRIQVPRRTVRAGMAPVPMAEAGAVRIRRVRMALTGATERARRTLPGAMDLRVRTRRRAPMVAAVRTRRRTPIVAAVRTRRNAPMVAAAEVAAITVEAAAMAVAAVADTPAVVVAGTPAAGEAVDIDNIV